MTEEAAAARLERYRDAWRNTPGVADLAAQLPDPARMEQLWGWSDYLAQVCLRDPPSLARLHTSGLLDRAYRAHEMQAALAAALSGVQDEASLESVLRQFRQREMLRLVWRDLSGLEARRA